MAEGSILVTINEFAEMANVPLATARHWRAKGEGPNFVVIGRRLLAKRSDVIAWIDAQFDGAA